MRSLATIIICLSVFGFCVYGLIFIYSSTLDDFSSRQIHFSNEFKKQLMFYFTGFLSLYVVSKIPYTKLVDTAMLLYVLNLAMLLYVKFFGYVAGGARSWINFGVTRFQPSETMKICWVLYMASILRYNKELRTIPGLFLPFIITGIPVLMIADQPDFGTAFTFIPTHFMILYIAGAKKRHLFAVVAAGLLAILPMYHFGLSDYQKKRIDGFLNPEAHTQGASYQMRNSILAIGEGHVLGKGVGNGRINQLSLLPESHTDFIFSIVASELGFVGAMGLVLCFTSFLTALCLLAYYTREPFGKICIISFAILIGNQVFINLGVTLGLLPTTGITLPFISSGGSSFVTCCLIVGIILSVSKHHVTVLGSDDFHTKHY